jgi:2-hydroxy-3-keto-5-methylthiopentenyl-1-phosphate phosphatase
MQMIQKYFPDIEECVRNFNINIESLQSNHSNNLLYTNAITQYKKLFLNLLLYNSKEEIDYYTKELVNFTIEHDISYLFLYSELVTVVRKLLSSLIKKRDLENIEEIDDYFSEHEYRITILYLEKFLMNLSLNVKCVSPILI